MRAKGFYDILERSASAEFHRVDRTVKINHATEVNIHPRLS